MVLDLIKSSSMDNPDRITRYLDRSNADLEPGQAVEIDLSNGNTISLTCLSADNAYDITMELRWSEHASIMFKVKR